MTTMASHSHLTLQPRTFSPEDLAGLARTFDDSACAVWIQDLSGRCVYQNPAARRAEPGAAQDLLHDILGPGDQRVGQLRIRPS
jgi:hypothetical protein